VKRILGPALLLAVVCSTVPASAQTSDADIQLTRAVVQTERQAVVAANLDLDDNEKAIFWPLYREYRAAVDQAVDTRVALLKTYFASHETLTDEEASALLGDFLAYEKNLLKVRTTYAKKMQKVLSGRTVAKFFQIENKMDTIIEYEMAGEVPLIK
jgi:Spy/CpxP family protein refolding chaperone